MQYYRASKEEVLSFLSQMKNVLNSPGFDLEKNFVLGGKVERKKNMETLMFLDMNKEDVIEELKRLKVSDYYHTRPDKVNPKMPDYHVFYIYLEAKETYIKVRVQCNNKVLCKSFHFAEYSHGSLPYNEED